MSKKSKRKTLRKGDIIKYASVILVVNTYDKSTKIYLCEIICNSTRGCVGSIVGYGHPMNTIKHIYRNRYWPMSYYEIKLVERRNTLATYKHICDNYDNYIAMPALPFTLK